MAEAPKQFPRSVWIGMSLAFGLLSLSYIIAFTNWDHDRPGNLPVLGRIAGFTLTNQDARTETLAGWSNHVWVADIIFTRCAGPCPRMTARMKSLQEALPQASQARLVTLTTDPDFDTPAVLKKYGERFGADFNRWTFLTGTKREIAGLAGNSLKLSAVPVAPSDQKDPADLFIHTTIFVVVDKHAQLRGIFETGGEGVDWTNVVQPKLLATIHQLEGEP